MFVSGRSQSIPRPQVLLALDRGDLGWLRRHASELAPIGLADALQICLIVRDRTGGGIKSIRLTAEGKTFATYEAACDYTYARPCPTNTGPQTLSLPTTQLTDGTHTITLTATDAAGIQASSSEQITVANEPPPAPTDLTASSSVGSDSYQVTWLDPPDPVTPVQSATYEVCHDNEEPLNCGPPTSTGARGPATVVLPESGTWTIIVWLTNAAGESNPANAARLTIPIAACCSTTGQHSEPRRSRPRLLHHCRSTPLLRPP
jgi:hypothetical protein